jgi:hypothetical protein
MLKNFLLALSLLINGIVAYGLWFQPTSSGERMTCDEARSDAKNKTATAAFAQRNGESLAKTHQFLTNSDYLLRNIDDQQDTLTLIYVADFFPSTCGIHMPGFDGGIVRVRTNDVSAPLVKQVY